MIYLARFLDWRKETFDLIISRSHMTPDQLASAPKLRSRKLVPGDFPCDECGKVFKYKKNMVSFFKLYYFVSSIRNFIVSMNFNFNFR